MGGEIFDFTDGDMAWIISDAYAIDSDGNTMMNIGAGQAVDLNTGEIHNVYGWDNNDPWNSDSDEGDDW